MTRTTVVADELSRPFAEINVPCIKQVTDDLNASDYPAAPPAPESEEIPQVEGTGQ
jgi:hypothetical protein